VDVGARPRPLGVRRADFEVLYRGHSREVWAAVYSLGMSAELALDCMQEAFLRLWQQWDKGESVHNPRAWLVRVARNLAQTHVRSAFGRNGTQPPQTMNGVAAKGPPALACLEREETFAQIRDALEQLRGTDRQVLTLRYALGYTTRQIADALCLTATAVNMRLSRARQRVAVCLVAQGVTAACQ
jgi:RNA polymerase sigma-70 factor (ECF subfamily)